MLSDSFDDEHTLMPTIPCVNTLVQLLIEVLTTLPSLLNFEVRECCPHENAAFVVSEVLAKLKGEPMDRPASWSVSAVIR